MLFGKSKLRVRRGQEAQLNLCVGEMTLSQMKLVSYFAKQFLMSIRLSFNVIVYFLPTNHLFLI